MTREEFQAMVRACAGECNDPTSEINEVIFDGRDLAEQLGAHDPELGKKITDVADSIEALTGYVMMRAAEMNRDAGSSK